MWLSFQQNRPGYIWVSSISGKNTPQKVNICSKGANLEFIFLDRAPLELQTSLVKNFRYIPRLITLATLHIVWFGYSTIITDFKDSEGNLNTMMLLIQKTCKELKADNLTRLRSYSGIFIAINHTSYGIWLNSLIC